MLTADQQAEHTGVADGVAAAGPVVRELLLRHGVPVHHLGLTMPADYERCRVMLVFHADTPPVMADGHWRVGVFMDAAASQEQAEKLGAVFAGRLGGPMAMLAPLFSEMLGSAPFSWAA